MALRGGRGGEAQVLAAPLGRISKAVSASLITEKGCCFPADEVGLGWLIRWLIRIRIRVPALGLPDSPLAQESPRIC